MQAQPKAAQWVVGYVDLRHGMALREVLEAELSAADGRLRGVRHRVSRDADLSLVNPLSAASAGLLPDKHYQAGVEQLADIG